MKFASEEIRAKVVQAYLNEKVPAKELSRIFGYSIASICNWVRTYQKENRLTAKPNGHRLSCFTEEEKEQLIELIEKNSSITLEQIKMHFAKNCSLAAIHKLVQNLGFVLKTNSQGQRTRTRKNKKNKD